MLRNGSGKRIPRNARSIYVKGAESLGSGRVRRDPGPRSTRDRGRRPGEGQRSARTAIPSRRARRDAHRPNLTGRHAHPWLNTSRPSIVQVLLQHPAFAHYRATRSVGRRRRFGRARSACDHRTVVERQSGPAVSPRISRSGWRSTTAAGTPRPMINLRFSKVIDAGEYESFPSLRRRSGIAEVASVVLPRRARRRPSRRTGHRLSDTRIRQVRDRERQQRHGSHSVPGRDPQLTPSRRHVRGLKSPAANWSARSNWMR